MIELGNSAQAGHLKKAKELADTAKALSANLSRMKHIFTFTSDKKRSQYSEICKWCQTNIKGEWMPLQVGKVICFRFAEKSDAVLFKLTWQ